MPNPERNSILEQGHRRYGTINDDEIDQIDEVDVGMPIRSSINKKKNIIEQDVIIHIKDEKEVLIERLKNINLKIKYYIEFVNTNVTTNNEKNREKTLLYLNHLDELYNTIPSFTKKEEEKKPQTLIGKTLSPLLSLLALGAGVAIRVAQRDFSVQVVANLNLQNQTLIEKLKELGGSMLEALKTPQNYALAGTDVIFSFFTSLFPFGLKNLIDLFSQESKGAEIDLNNFAPLEVIIQFLEKSNYKELELDENQISLFCDELEEIIQKQEETNSFDSKELNISHEELIKKLNQSGKTDLKNEDYSWGSWFKNGLSNGFNFLAANALNHFVITASSAYTAETLTWDKYINDLTTLNNVFSTLARATIMKNVNDYLIKKPLESIFNAFSECYRGSDNKTSPEKWKNFISCSIKKWSKPAQGTIVIASFMTITFVSNFIKTLAADVTQNKGDMQKALDQLKKTFLKWEMALSAVGVTGSDMYNLKLKMKKFCSLGTEQKEQNKIINEVFKNYITNSSNTDSENIIYNTDSSSTPNLNEDSLMRNEYTTNTLDTVDGCSNVYTLKNGNIKQVIATIHNEERSTFITMSSVDKGIGSGETEDLTFSNYFGT